MLSAHQVVTFPKKDSKLASNIATGVAMRYSFFLQMISVAFVLVPKISAVVQVSRTLVIGPYNHLYRHECPRNLHKTLPWSPPSHVSEFGVDSRSCGQSMHRGGWLEPSLQLT